MGGAVDRHAAMTANWLVGNSDNEPVLEIPLIGPTLRFHNEATIGLSGANLSPSINGKPIPIHTTLSIHVGDELSFGKLKAGCRAYLGIFGKWKVPKWIDSCSPVLGIKKIPQTLAKGDIVIIETPNHLPQPIKQYQPVINQSFAAFYPGPEWDECSDHFKSEVLNKTFYVDIDSNRMGCRLNPVLNLDSYSRIISSAVQPGTIQLTPSGQLIILLADAQTVGGYPRIGLISMDDLNRIAQLKPKDSLQFHLGRRF